MPLPSQAECPQEGGAQRRGEARGQEKEAHRGGDWLGTNRSPQACPDTWAVVRRQAPPPPSSGRATLGTAGPCSRPSTSLVKERTALFTAVPPRPQDALGRDMGHKAVRIWGRNGEEAVTPALAYAVGLVVGGTLHGSGSQIPHPAVLTP